LNDTTQNQRHSNDGNFNKIKQLINVSEEYTKSFKRLKNTQKQRHQNDDLQNVKV
jgi:hypothetical protein